MLPAAAPAPAQAIDEYEVKAAFLFNFMRFVEWPPAGPAGPGSPFQLCILGDDPFGPLLDRMVHGKTVGGHPLQILRLKDAPEVRPCRIVFVRREENGKAAKLMEAVRGLPILTIGESHEFAQIGGMIYLTMQNDRVGIVINPKPAERAGLRISGKLMSLARILKNGEAENQ